MGKDNEIELIRVYDAPVKTVWHAWVDDDKVGKWWGPRGFSITTHSKDLRPGGHWKYTMHGPDGKDWPNITQYHEVEPYKKMVYDHGATEKSPPMFKVTVLFEDLKGRTRMTMTMTLPDAAAARNTRAFIKQAGGNATWDRLAEQLEKDATGQEVFVIAHAFDAPIERVFEAWADPERMAHWMGPKGATMEILKADVRKGGGLFYKMPSGESTMYGKIEYLQIAKPDRLVYRQCFCDAQGNVARHPMAPAWPEFMHTTVDFVSEGLDRTRVIVRWAPEKPTAAELEIFVKARAGMTGGWDGSFDKLEDYLKEDA
jgi:uncharacterized protein YndB with AHSA1/START domain